MFRVTLAMMTNLKICKTDELSGLATVQEVAPFLAEYASWLLGCGATCVRIEKNVGRIADRLGMEADITVMPSHVNLSLSLCGSADSYISVRKIQKCGINFNINAQLSRLSWEFADGKCDFDTVRKRFAEIVKTPSTGKTEVLLLTSFANAAFCRLFGGDLTAMAIVFVSTMAGYRLKQIMLDDKRDVRLAFLCASFFSASLSAVGHVFGIGTTPEIAVGASVLYLIPGVPYINAVSDMIGGHYLCAFSRFMDAAVLTACLSVGLCAGMFLLGLKYF